LKNKLKALFKYFGYTIESYSIFRSHELRKIKLIQNLDIDLVIDGGANIGQYGFELRRLGYKKKIISYEPLNRQFEKLRRNTENDRLWFVNNYALGDANKESEIYVSEISQVSSMFKATGGASTSNWITDRKQKVFVRRLSDLIEKEPERNIYLKLDVQGSERQALEGLGGSFDRIKAIELEVSTVELYKGEALFPEIVHFLEGKNYSIFSIDPV